MQDFIERHLNAYAHDDWDTYRQGLTAEATYEEIPTGLRVSGVDNYIAAVKTWKTPFPDLRASVVNFIASGDQTVLELEWTGTHRGPLSLPFTTVAPTNERVTVRGVLISRHENGKIAHTRHYFDVLSTSEAVRRAVLGQPPTIATTGDHRPVRH